MSKTLTQQKIRYHLEAELSGYKQKLNNEVWNFIKSHNWLGAINKLTSERFTNFLNQNLQPTLMAVAQEFGTAMGQNQDPVHQMVVKANMLLAGTPSINAFLSQFIQHLDLNSWDFIAMNDRFDANTFRVNLAK